MKFKVGDKVRVKSLEWYNENKNEDGLVYVDKTTNIFFTDVMKWMCGYVMQIKDVCDDYYKVFGYAGIWQDWMLEDEVIKEEECPVLKVLNSIQKRMTKEQAFEYLSNKKFKVETLADAKKVTEKLKSLGGVNCNELSFWYMLDNTLSGLLYVSTVIDTESYDASDYKEITLQDILSIEIVEEEPEPKPKFNPKTLQPFDKVLVRDKENDVWLCNLFSHIGEGKYMYYCAFDYWIFCVPYNEETEHLVGTTEEAPEFYQVWKK